MKLDNTFAWALALTPLALLIVDAVLWVSVPQEHVMNGASLIVALGLWIVLGIADSRRVRAAGYPASAGFAVLLVPIYLFARAARTRSTYAIPMVCLVALAVSILGTVQMASLLGVPQDAEWTEGAIRDWVRDDLDFNGRLAVECPEPNVRPGDSYTCTLEAGREMSFVDVTVQNEYGDILWEIRR